MADVPDAYFITMHTYGTWLHGREDGSVDRDHNIYGEPFAPVNAEREAAMRRRMRGDAMLLGTPEQRLAVQEACLETCGYRGWPVHALHVRTTHVHVVVTGLVDPDKLMNDLKTYATRRLRKLQLVSREKHVWSRHGSTRYLWDDAAVLDKADYVVRKQGEPLDPLPYVSDECKRRLDAAGGGAAESP